jgi:hypothetical protein
MKLESSKSTTGESKVRNRSGSLPGILLLVFSALFLFSCVDVAVPGVRSVSLLGPTTAEQRKPAINERPDSVLYLPLGEDVLIPTSVSDDPMPSDVIGPFELRSETLAGTLQLILADYDIPLAFETEEGLTRRITVANLKGPLNRVVKRVCGLADLYCAFEDGLLVIKEVQTFTVSVPPVGGDTDLINAITTGLQAITGLSPIVDNGTRTIVYTATHRTAELAERYFQRMRKNTAMIIFEIYIWEVSLNSENDAGIDWSQIETFGKFDVGIDLPGGSTSDSPISIGLPTTGGVNFANNVLDFISTYGSVKTISQPQVTLLSGSEASLRDADTINYISSFERTFDDGDENISTETDSVDTGFTLTISGAWDNATVYGNIEIELQEFRGFEEFQTGTDSQLKLPETTERELVTQVRIRPGDSLLIAGLIRENDEFDKSGPGLMDVFLPTSRRASVFNSELVFLLRPRVVVYTDEAQQNIFPDDSPFDYAPDFDLNPNTDLTYGLVKPKKYSVREGNKERQVPELYVPRKDPEMFSYSGKSEPAEANGMEENDSPVGTLSPMMLDPGSR